MNPVILQKKMAEELKDTFVVSYILTCMKEANPYDYKIIEKFVNECREFRQKKQKIRNKK